MNAVYLILYVLAAVFFLFAGVLGWGWRTGSGSGILKSPTGLTLQGLLERLASVSSTTTTPPEATMATTLPPLEGTPRIRVHLVDSRKEGWKESVVVSDRNANVRNAATIEEAAEAAVQAVFVLRWAASGDHLSAVQRDRHLGPRLGGGAPGA
jgi:hypothetical protein